MARTRKKATQQGPRMYWRNGRAYGDFRSYADVGGDREALARPGTRWGTTDPDVASALFAARLAELDTKREGSVGIESRRSTTLAGLVQHHLVMKAKAGRTSDSHLFDLESRLRAAIEFFGAGRDPQSIEPTDVRAWADELARGGRRRPGTVRHYLNALSGLYGRAQEGLHVAPGYNPVQMLQEKPTGHHRGEAAFFEVADAALLLEASRVVESQDRGSNTTPSLHAIVATMLLTGGRRSEVLGLDVEDVSFDRGVVRFRPNVHRGLKTTTSVREVPLWPQLREILQAHMFGGEAPRTSGLLFHGVDGGMVGDLRKSLDAMGELCGFETGEVRTRRFRHTYCSARLQTVERILRPGRDARDEDSWDYVEVPRDRVAREMGHGGTQLVARVYGHAPRLPYRADVVEYRVEKHREHLGARLATVAAAGG